MELLKSMNDDKNCIQVGVVPPGCGCGDSFEMARRIYSAEGLSPTIRTFCGGNLEPKIKEDGNVIRIRKLTPRECWRLMDFDDSDFDKAEKTNSNSQLYKQAGNSIVVNVLTAIIGQMFEGHENDYRREENAKE